MEHRDRRGAHPPLPKPREDPSPGPEPWQPHPGLRHRAWRPAGPRWWSRLLEDALPDSATQDCKLGALLRHMYDLLEQIVLCASHVFLSWLSLFIRNSGDTTNAWWSEMLYKCTYTGVYVGREPGLGTWQSATVPAGGPESRRDRVPVGPPGGGATDTPLSLWPPRHLPRCLWLPHCTWGEAHGLDDAWWRQQGRFCFCGPVYLSVVVSQLYFRLQNGASKLVQLSLSSFYVF